MQADIRNRIETNRERFRRYNERKLANLLAADIDPKAIELFDLIPIMLHVPVAELPGFVDSEEVPHGIENYIPSVRAQGIIHSRFPTARIVAGKSERCFIRMLALIGSTGTIAFGRESDLDFWICYHAQDATPEELRLFKIKCAALENWVFDRYGIEVHFYVNEIGRARRNLFDEDEKNIAGSAVGQLLKEEFFRSSIVLQGRTPFWWLVPFDCDDATYETWLASVAGTPIAGECIDLGNLYRVRDEEFLIAGLFQLLKSLGSPFKSIIKLGLIERYLGESGDNPFISSIIKRNIQEERFDTREIDAYTIMFDHVFSFYSSIGSEAEVLDLLRRSFYLKVGPRLSEDYTGDRSFVEEKRRVMRAYVREWNWSEGMIRQMDNFQNWGIEPVGKLLNGTKKFVLSGYKRLISSIEAKQVNIRLSGDELKGISRKLSSHFLVEENKIDNTLSFKSYPPEKLLKIEYVRDKEGHDLWFLSKRLIINDRPHRVIIYKERTIFALVVWLSLNGLYLKDFTRLEIDTGLHAIEPNFIRELIPEISARFAVKRLKLQDRHFLQDPFPLLSFIIINPYSKYAHNIEDIFFLYHNSWGETRFEVYKKQMDLLRIAPRIINGCLMTGSAYENPVTLISAQPFRASKDFLTLRRITEGAVRAFLGCDGDEKRRYVTAWRGAYIVFQTKRGGENPAVEVNAFDGKIKMLYHISFNNGMKNRLSIDPELRDLQSLRQVLANRREGCIQIYFEKRNKYNHFYVTDEQGALFFFRKDLDSLFEYLTRLYLFATNVLAEVLEYNAESSLAGKVKPVVIYQIREEQEGNVTVREIRPDISTRMNEIMKRVAPLALCVFVNEEGRSMYRFLLPDGRYSQAFRRDAPAEIAQRLGELPLPPHQGSHYYLTSMDLSLLQDRQFTHYTSFAFNEKNRFELMVEKALGTGAVSRD